MPRRTAVSSRQCCRPFFRHSRPDSGSKHLFAAAALAVEDETLFLFERVFLAAGCHSSRRRQRRIRRPLFSALRPLLRWLPLPLRSAHEGWETTALCAFAVADFR